jgi:hypothetical protein
MELRCSFCHKAQSEVRKLVAGPSVFICNECVDLCTQIIRADHEPSPPAPAPPPASELRTTLVTCKLCGQVVLWDDALLIQARGHLCRGCAWEVEATVAQARENHDQLA